MMGRTPEQETLAERWQRRGLTLPAYAVLTLAVSATFPALVMLALVVDLICRNRLVFTRTLAFLTVYLWCETIGVVIGFFLWVARAAGSPGPVTRNPLTRNPLP